MNYKDCRNRSVMAIITYDAKNNKHPGNIYINGNHSFTFRDVKQVKGVIKQLQRMVDRFSNK